MTRTELFLTLAVFVGVWVGLECGYRVGHISGYDTGWSDAHCGPGLNCEAGQN